MNPRPFIMAGGVGKRLGLLSTAERPKQFLKAFGDRSMLQETLIRNSCLGKPVVACNKKHSGILEGQSLEIGFRPEKIFEPFVKNTAACAITASLYLKTEAVICLLPSDHFIGSQEEYMSTLTEAAPYAQKYGICSIGLAPSKASTRYGYIRKGGSIGGGAFLSSGFTEKPEILKASSYITEGNYLWNSGIFLFDPEFLSKKAKEFIPDTFKSVEEALLKAEASAAGIFLSEEPYGKIKNLSLDEALIEKLKEIPVIEASFLWKDLGDREEFPANADRIFLPPEKLKPANDRTPGKDILRKPWGYCELIGSGKNYKIKLITVKPGEKLSMQTHRRRVEHWTIVEGEAEIEIENLKKTAGAGNFFYVPRRARHRIGNLGSSDLKIIEIQTGDYLEEDDIKRLDDIYGRHKLI